MLEKRERLSLQVLANNILMLVSELGFFGGIIHRRRFVEVERHGSATRKEIQIDTIYDGH